METSDARSDDGRGRVKSAARALDLLDEIAAHGPGTQLQLGHRLGVPKSSMHALLRTMIGRGWLETDPTASIYRLGVRSLTVTASFLDTDPAVQRARPLLDEVSAVTEETVHLGRLVDADIVYLAKRESPRPLRMYSAVGRRLPAVSTALGRALLAEQPEGVRDALVPSVITPMTTHTTTKRGDLTKLISRAAVDGFSVESEESCLGVRCYAVALPLGPATHDALGVAAPISRLDDSSEATIVECLLGVKSRLEHERRNSLVR